MSWLLIYHLKKFTNSSNSSNLSLLSRTNNTEIVFLKTSNVSLKLSNISNHSSNKSLTIYSKIKANLDKNPLTKLALVTCAVVIFFSGLFEYFNKKPKSKVDIFSTLPPKPVNNVFEYAHVKINHFIKTVRNPLYRNSINLLIHGGCGTGKTSLARQVSERIISYKKSFLYLFGKPYLILYLNAKNEESFLNSLEKIIYNLRISQTSISIDDQEFKFQNYLNVINQIILKRKCIYIIDDLNLSTMSLLESFHSHLKSPVAYIITSNKSIDSIFENSFNFKINLEDYNLIDSYDFSHWVRSFAQYNISDLSLNSIFKSIGRNISIWSQLLYSLSLLKKSFLQEIQFNCNDCDALIEYIHSQTPVKMLNNSLNIASNVKSPLQRLQILNMQIMYHFSPVLQHSIDMLATLKPTIPIPMSTLITYLESPFLKNISDLQSIVHELPCITQKMTENFQDEMDLTENEKEVSSNLRKKFLNFNLEYLDSIKKYFKTQKQAYFPMEKQDLQNDIPLNISPSITILRNCPLFLCEVDPISGIETICFRDNNCQNLAKQLFEFVSIDEIENAILLIAKNNHEKSWITKFSHFNQTNEITRFRKSLPGVSLSSDLSDKSKTHLSSFYQRIISSFVEDFDYLNYISINAINQKNHLINLHGNHILSNYKDLLSPRALVDTLKMQASLNARNNCYDQSVESLFKALSIQNVMKETFSSIDRAITFKFIAEIYKNMNDLDNAKLYIEKSITLFKHSSQLQYLPQKQLDFCGAMLLSGSLLTEESKYIESKILFENSLSILNILANDSNISRDSLNNFLLKTFSELSNIYLCLGEEPFCMKMINMALDIFNKFDLKDNFHIVKLYNTLSTLQALRGNKISSKKNKLTATNYLNIISKNPIKFIAYT